MRSSSDLSPKSKLKYQQIPHHYFHPWVSVSAPKTAKDFRRTKADVVLLHLFKNRNLPHRLAETDCRAVCPWRVPRKQRGGHQRATHHGRPEGEQTAVLSEPVTHGNRPSSPGSIINWNPQCWCASICLGCNIVWICTFWISGVSSVLPHTINSRMKCLNWFQIVIWPRHNLLHPSAKTGLMVPPTVRSCHSYPW